MATPVNLASWASWQPEWMNQEPLQELSESTGESIDRLNYVVCLLLAFPLSSVFHLIPKSNATLRHIVGLFIGLLFGFFCFRTWLFHVFFTSTVSYFILVSDTKGQYAHWVTMIFAMSYLVSCHAFRQFNYWGSYTLDYTGPQMILTQKLTNLAYAYHDGVGRKKESLNPNQSRVSIVKLPSLLEYYGHVFFFPGFLAGPVHQFKDYINFMEGTEAHGKTPSGMFVAIKKLITAFLCIGFTFLPGKLLGYHANGKAFGTDLDTMVEDDFHESISFPMRILQMCLACIVICCGYYFAWTLADGANNLAGFGYTKGEDGKGKGNWNHISNVNIVGVEGALNLKGVLDNWNIQTSHWLRYTMYERVKTQQVTKTMMLSALWHGLYPGYFLTFGTASLVTEAARKARRFFRPKFQGSYVMAKVYDFGTWIFAILTLNFMVGPFILNDVYRSVLYFKYLYFYGHVMCLLMVLSPFGNKPRKPKQEKKEEKKEN